MNPLKVTTVDVLQNILDAAGKIIATADTKNVTVDSYAEKDIALTIPVTDPTLWSLKILICIN